MADNNVNETEVSKSTNPAALNYDQIISLLEIRESEWEHRNNLLWSQVFKLFYFSIFIMALPLLSGGLGVNMPKISSLLFPITGIIAATFSYYISLSYAQRLHALQLTIRRLIKRLPKKYRTISLASIPFGKLFMPRHTIIIPTVIYFVELILAGIIIYCINKNLILPPAP